MEKKKVLSGSVQEKGGKLYAVIGYTDPITEKRKTKWIGLDLPISSGCKCANIHRTLKRSTMSRRSN